MPVQLLAHVQRQVPATLFVTLVALLLQSAAMLHCFTQLGNPLYPLTHLVQPDDELTLAKHWLHVVPVHPVLHSQLHPDAVGVADAALGPQEASVQP